MGKLTNKQFAGACGVGFLIGILVGVAGALDYQDEQDQIDEYKMMVCAGCWPDYQKMKPECPNE